MQTKMFVFIGIPNSNSLIPIEEVEEQLKLQFSSIDIFLQFTKKDKLLTSRYNNVSYYISVIDSKKEMKDWLQMAKDFELSLDTTSLTEKTITYRYNKLRITQPRLYSEVDYLIGQTIFNSLSHFKSIDIVSFQ